MECNSIGQIHVRQNVFMLTKNRSHLHTVTGLDYPTHTCLGAREVRRPLWAQRRPMDHYDMFLNSMPMRITQRRNTTALQLRANKSEDHGSTVVTERRRNELVIDKTVRNVDVEPFRQHLEHSRTSSSSSSRSTSYHPLQILHHLKVRPVSKDFQRQPSV